MLLRSFTLRNKRLSLKNVRIFGCAAYDLRMRRHAKTEPRAFEGIYLETLDHGIYKVLIKRRNVDQGVRNFRIIQFLHVTFGETQFLGAPELEMAMEEGDASNSDYSTDASDTCTEIFEGSSVVIVHYSR